MLSTAHGTSLHASPLPKIDLYTPTPADMDSVRAIFREYAQGLGVDLCFQDFETELATLPGEYAEPRGALLLAAVDGQLAGCCALRPMDATDYPNAAEMKRLYVRPAFRGLGLGRQLAEAVLDAARQGGYSCVLLDTLDDMEAARALYEDLGFEEIPPYYHNPIPGAHYLKADVERTTGW
jgi:putative acetyltransferase